MVSQPKWSTPNRKAHLVQLFLRSGGFCVFGHKDCTIPSHHYEPFTDSLIKDWQVDDREVARLDWQAERQAIHSLGETRLPIRGRFNNISRDIWGGSQPLYYLESLGMNGLTCKPFAKVKLSSSYLRLYVDLGDSLRKVSKNMKRKAIRYGKPLPKSQSEAIAERVSKAVRDYLAH